MSGRIINLDTAVERWGQMRAQLEGLGWTQSHRRYSAQTADADEARHLGLRNSGELGLWRTTTTLLEQWLGEEPAAGDVMYILEVDAILNPALPMLIDLFRQQKPPLDMLFSEPFLTTDPISVSDAWRRCGRAKVMLCCC